MKAIEAYLAACGALPVNIRVVIEGEEECGGVALHQLVTGIRSASPRT
jgi:acetylornithine deacetylase/succinyl-diaminopimelate desuccinylase-like protein